MDQVSFRHTNQDECNVCGLPFCLPEATNKDGELPKSKSWRGLFVVFEGIDRCGKSTQLEHLSSVIAPGHKKIRFPNRDSQTGKKLDEFLKSGNMKHLSNEERITLFSDNRKEAAADIVNTLESGKDVLCDRYVPSALAYEMAHGGDYTNLIAHEIGLPKPDLVLLVDTPPEVAATRSQYGGEVYEKVDFQTKVASAYKELVRKGTEHWHVLDGTKARDDLKNMVTRIYLATTLCVGNDRDSIRYYTRD